MVKYEQYSERDTLCNDLVLSPSIIVPSLHPPTHTTTHLTYIYLSTYHTSYLHLPIHLPTHLTYIYLSTYHTSYLHLPIHLPTHLTYICLSTYPHILPTSAYPPTTLHTCTPMLVDGLQRTLQLPLFGTATTLSVFSLNALRWQLASGISPSPMDHSHGASHSLKIVGIH